MGKTLNSWERKNHKYTSREEERQRKERQYTKPAEKKAPPKPKWRPHSEIDAD